jgi:hypothetical protein
MFYIYIYRYVCIYIYIYVWGSIYPAKRFVLTGDVYTNSCFRVIAAPVTCQRKLCWQLSNGGYCAVAAAAVAAEDLKRRLCGRRRGCRRPGSASAQRPSQPHGRRRRGSRGRRRRGSAAVAAEDFKRRLLTRSPPRPSPPRGRRHPAAVATPRPSAINGCGCGCGCCCARSRPRLRLRLRLRL